MRFYTTPRYGFDWGFIIANHNFVNSRLLNTTVLFQHGIFDCGIEAMTKTGEYPSNHIENHVAKAYELLEKHGYEKVWVTIPDYCDDVNTGVCPGSVEKTIANNQHFPDEYPEINWLPVLQAKYLDKKSFMRSIDAMKETDHNPPHLAIGTVCKTNNLKFIKWCAMTSRHHFPHTWLHGFGVSLKALPFLRFYWNSWDSLAWGWMVSTQRRPELVPKDRSDYFWRYINRARIIDPDFEEPILP